MAVYIRAVDVLSRQIGRTILPPDREIEATLHALSGSPVVGYEPFTEAEVRLIAAYRSKMARGSYDAVWRGLVGNAPEAWAYAIHEAAELQALADLGLNPFDTTLQQESFEEAHLRAVIRELFYLKDWSRQAAIETSELAIEIENPLRKLFGSQARLVRLLQSRQGWQQPTASERQAARRFWQRILTGEIP